MIKYKAFYIDEEDEKMVEAMAKEDSRTYSGMIRKIIRDAMERRKIEKEKI